MRKANYPEQKYFTGFDARYLKKNANIEQIKEQMVLQAQSNLSESIYVSMKSEITSKMHNVNAVTVEDFKKISTSYTAVELVNVKTDFVTTKRNKEAMAFAWVEKSEVGAYYQKLTESLRLQIEGSLELARDLEEKKDIDDALENYQEASVLLQKLKGAIAVLMAVGDFGKYKTAQQFMIELEAEHSKGVQRIANNKGMDMDGLTALAAVTFESKVDRFNKIRFENIYFEDTQMSSPFSIKCTELLKSKMVNRGFSVGEAGDPQLNGLITGNYWDEGEEIRVIFNVFEQDESWKNLVMSVEGWVSKTSLNEDGLKWEIEKQEEAKSKLEAFENEPLLNAGMSVEVWTNRGRDGATFEEGDRLKLFVRASKPGYLRLMNYWADGTKLMLMDNYYVAEDKVDEVIEIGDSWDTACPCGVEFIQLNGQNRPFEALTVEKVEGFDFVRESLVDVIKNNRGFKKMLTVEGNYMGEDRITVTTMPER